MSDSFFVLTVTLTRVIIPLIIVFGTFGNLFNLILFRSDRLRVHTCSMYFFSLSLVNMFYTSVLLVQNLLIDGYGIDLSRYSNVYCKLSSYFLNLCPNLSVYYIVLASIDRYFSSSLDAQKRRFITEKVARILLVSVTTIFVVITMGSWIAFDSSSLDQLGCICRSDSLFNQVYLFLNIILYVIVGPFLLVIFGLLTIWNITRIAPNRVNHYRRTERELIRMLFLQVASHILFSCPFCLTFLLLVVPIPFRFTSTYFTLLTLCKIPFYLTFISQFFLYILSGRIYREEFLRLIQKIFRRRTNRLIGPINPFPNTIPLTVQSIPR